MQVVDELSDDGTPRQLVQMGVRVLQPLKRLGVTHNWNMVGVIRAWLLTTLRTFFHTCLLDNGCCSRGSVSASPKPGTWLVPV